MIAASASQNAKAVGGVAHHGGRAKKTKDDSKEGDHLYGVIYHGRNDLGNRPIIRV